jgi:hypothetical protein
MGLFDKFSSSKELYVERIKQWALTGDHKIYRASNPASGANVRGFTAPEKSPNEMEGLLQRFLEQKGYKFEKDKPTANFTFSPERAAQFAVQKNEPSVFLIRITDSKFLKNHRTEDYDFSLGFKDSDLWIKQLSMEEIVVLVVPPRFREFTENFLTQEGLDIQVESPGKWPTENDAADFDELLEKRRDLLAKYLKSI